MTPLAVAIALNSLWASIPADMCAIVLLIRTRLEDETLENVLPGYAKCAARVRYRLVRGLR